QLVSNHIFGYVHRDKLIAVMHGKGVTDQLRHNGRPPGPSLDDGLLARFLHGLYLVQQAEITVRSFFNRTSHYFFLLDMMSRSEYLFGRRVFFPFAYTPVRDLGWPPDARPSPPPMGWSTGFMATPRVRGRIPSQRLRPALPQLSFM